jgi:hypothetical protein
MSFNLGHLFAVMNYLIPFFVLGLIFSLKKFKKRDLIILIFFVLVLISYIKVPFKTPRYLFLLVLPAVYFSCAFFKRFKFRKSLLFILIILNVFTLFFIVDYLPEILPEIDSFDLYEESINYTEDCLVMSNAWVYLNYMGRESEPFPSESIVGYELKNGKILVLYKHITEPDYVSNKEFLNNLNVIKETDDYIILGDLNDCKKKEKYVDHYLLRYKERIELVYNKTEDISNCAILFKGRLSDICKLTKVI